MLNIKPIDLSTLDQNELSNVNEVLSSQTLSQARPRSTDPKGYPLFVHEPGKKGTVYVPDFRKRDAEGKIVLGRDGNPVLEWDRSLIHTVKRSGGNGSKVFDKIRCINGLAIGGTDYDGTCPCCRAVSDCFDWANFQIKRELDSQGLNFDDKSDAVRSIKMRYYQENAVEGAREFYTFPILFLPKGEKTATKYWFTISKSQFDRVILETGLSTLDKDDDVTEADVCDRVFLYNNPVDPSSQYARRDAANQFTMVMVDKEKLHKALSRAFTIEDLENWGADKARATLYDNMLYPRAGIQDTIDGVMKQTRALLEIATSKQGVKSVEGKEGNVVAGNLPASMGVAPTTDEDVNVDPEVLEDNEDDFDSLESLVTA